MITEPLFTRREPCPCGSGKRFKNCCEGLVTIDTAKLREAERQKPGTVAAMADALDAELERRNAL